MSSDIVNITNLAREGEIRKQRRYVGLVFSTIFALLVVGIGVIILLFDLDLVLRFAFSNLNRLFLSILNNSLLWIFAFSLIIVIFLFEIFLPKRQVKSKPMSTARIAEIGVITAAVAVIFIMTGWLVDTLLPFIGCISRTSAVAVFLSGIRHYRWWELLLITTLALVIAVIIYPCPMNIIAIPISIAFVTVYGLLRRHMPPWASISIGAVFAYLTMIAMIAIVSPENFWMEFRFVLMYSWVFLLIIPGLIWWRTRKQQTIKCYGCDKDCDRYSIGRE